MPFPLVLCVIIGFSRDHCFHCFIHCAKFVERVSLSRLPAPCRAPLTGSSLVCFQQCCCGHCYLPDTQPTNINSDKQTVVNKQTAWCISCFCYSLVPTATATWCCLAPGWTLGARLGWGPSCNVRQYSLVACGLPTTQTFLGPLGSAYWTVNALYCT